MKKTALALSTALFATSAAQAQEWTYNASFYLFAAETDTGFGGREATLSFSDALDNLDVAAMGTFEANNGQWGVIVDYMLTDLSFGNSTPGANFGDLNTSAKTQILTAALSYRLYDTGTFQTDVTAGARWFDTKTTLELTPGLLPGRKTRFSDSWIDPIVGFRTRMEFGGNWSGTAVADVGGLNDRRTWQVVLTANYAINENWQARFGYRYIDIRNDDDDQDYVFKQSGPIFGLTYSF
jgi:hypothetical protein